MSALHKFTLHETAHEFNIKKIKTRKPAPPQRHWNPHANVTNFRHETAYAFASACLALKIEAIYSPENPVNIYQSAQRNISEDTFTQCTIHTPYRSQYAAIALTTPCKSFTQILSTERVIFSQALTLAP